MSRRGFRSAAVAIALGKRAIRAKHASKSDWAPYLAERCVAAGLPAPTRELAAIPGRRFRFDCAWADAKVAAEAHGGEWASGRHAQGTGVSADSEKQNLAQLEGWILLEFPASKLRREESAVIDTIRRALDLRTCRTWGSTC